MEVLLPTAKIALVLLPVADAHCMALEAEEAEVFVSPTYVYLLRLVLPPPCPKIPTKLFPAAEPYWLVQDEAVATLTTSPEYVYLLRMLLQPKANIAKVPSGTAGTTVLLNALIGDGP
jgi:hypothetical protein